MKNEKKAAEEAADLAESMNIFDKRKKLKFERIPAKEFLSLLEKDPKLVTMKLPDNIIREDHVTIAQPDGKFKLQADIYYKEKEPASKRPCVIFMHDFARGRNPILCGDRQGACFALHGLVFISLYYRPPEYSPYPAALEDLKTCVRWVRSKAKEYSIDPNMIVAFGSSAGSMSALLGAATNGDKRFEKPCGYNEFSSDINLAILNACICDVERDFKGSGVMKLMLGCTYKEAPDIYKEYSPINNIKKSMPPFLIINGDRDTGCSIEAARAIRDKALKIGVKAKLIELPGRDHGCSKHPEDLFMKLTEWKDFILDNWKKK